VRIFESLETTEVEGKWLFGCADCGSVLCPVTENYKIYALKHDSPQSKGEPSYLKPSDSFILREYCCPSCGALFEVDLLPKAESDNAEIDIPSVILL
jgi:acetone carboxylase gamma subunit